MHRPLVAMLLISRFHQCNVKRLSMWPKTILMLTHSVHSAGFLTGLDAYDAGSTPPPLRRLAPRPPVDRTRVPNDRVGEMETGPGSQKRDRTASGKVRKSRRPGNAVRVACERCR